MKKFFKWLWYNKEQLGSILYNAALLALSQFAIWTDTIATVFPAMPAEVVLPVNIVVCVASVAFTALTVRNVCVKYGLSSLDTIDAVLAERAEISASKLSPEQKQVYRGYLTTLNETLTKAKKELQAIEAEFAKLTILHNADSTLVPDYNSKALTYQSKIAGSNEAIASLEGKIAQFKALLSGKTIEQ